jgi:acyl carrier protein phosphodiesterase
MNHLAHALLAGDDPDYVLGGMLGDFVHGPVPTSLRPGVQAGLRLHRAIDVYTDSHPAVVALRQHFQPPYRRYAGIVIDVWFDHLLARDFARWCDQPLAVFSQALRDLLARHASELPEDLLRFSVYMERYDLPLAYRERPTIARVLSGISHRLSRTNPLATSIEEAERLEIELITAFDAFFPELQHFAKEQRA